MLTMYEFMFRQFVFQQNNLNIIIFNILESSEWGTSIGFQVPFVKKAVTQFMFQLGVLMHSSNIKYV